MSGHGERTDGEGSGDATAPEARPDIAERVLRYFRDNPTAMDSMDGIARFWVHEDRRVVERCLAVLHTRGLLAKRTIAGAEFYSLPQESKGPPLPAGGTGTAVGESTGPRAKTPSRILVVDDDPDVREFFVDALTAAGHSVTAADDGGPAIEMLRTDHFDLIVADVVMPSTSGIEVLQAARRESPATEVIMVTAHPDMTIAIEALRLGAYDFITKPIGDLDAFYRVTERALDTVRLNADNRLLVENLQSRNRELTHTVARLAAVNEIATAMTGLLELEQIYATLVQLVAQHLQARRVSVLIEEPESQTMTLVASVGLTEDEARNKQVRVGEGIAGRVAVTQSPLLVKDIERTDLKHLRTGGKYATSSFMITPLMLSYPIRYRRKRVGVINVSDKHSGEAFDEPDLQFLSTLASQMAVAIENARLVKEMEGGYLGVLVALIKAVEDSSPQTRGHSGRVMELATAVARAIGLEGPRLENLQRAAALHEIGRLLTPAEQGRSIGGPGSADAAAMAAGRVLAPIASLREVRDVILNSLSRADAPLAGLTNVHATLSVEAGILAACEEFVALTQEDPDDADRAQQALEKLRQESGVRHDPDVIAALARVLDSRRA